MKHLFGFLLLSGIFAWFSHTLIQDPGYVLILFHGWQIQSSVIVFICISLTSILFVFSGFKILNTLIHIPKTIQIWIKKLQQLRQTKHLRQGLEAYYKGDWLDALKGFSSLPHATTPWMVDLMAAEAAQHQGHLKERDQFLHLAAHQEPKARTTILLFQAHLQFEQQQFEQAQATLNHIAQFQKTNPPEWYTLQSKLYLEFKEFQKGLTLLQIHAALKNKIPAYDDLYKNLFIELLTTYFEKQEYEKAFEQINNLPKNLKTDLKLLQFFSPLLITHEKYASSMERLIKKALKKQTEAKAILQLIGLLPENSQWLKWVEKIEIQEKPDADIYLKLGQVKAKYQLWGAAIQDIQQSIAIRKTADAYTSLARIYLALNQTANACQAMQQSLHLQNE